MVKVASAMYNMPEFVVSSNEHGFQGMEDTTLFDELPMDYFDGLDFQSFVSNTYYQNPHSVIDSPAQRPSKVKTNMSSTSSRLISFEQYSNNNNMHQFYNMGSNVVKLETPNELENVMNFSSINEELMRANMAGTMTRNPIQAQDHVMAEKRRREKLNQKFIALSSIIPGLKKVSLFLLLFHLHDCLIELELRV